MKKTTYLTLVLLFSVVFTQAQSEKIVKLYLNSNFGKSLQQQFQGDTTITTNRSGTHLLGFSPALMILQESGRYTEWELSSFRASSYKYSQILSDSSNTGPDEYLSGSQNFSFSFSGRYEYGFNLRTLFGGKQEGLSYTLGLAALPYLSTSLMKPYTSNSFRRGHFNVGARIDVIPRILYTRKGKWFIDLNFPLSMMNGELGRTRIDNPSQPLEDQRYWRTNVSFLPFEFKARLGVGIKI